uniref:isochorismatase family protein n=1 Tax=Thaumasiovibrio occultus TaxID=1891184 RepID=UPI000B353040|nr:isochorismatase family protein [Thaumasiovibrio occultus]
MTQPTNTVLVLVDVQGKLAQLMHQKESLFQNLQRLIKGAQALDIPIIWVEQNPEKLGPTIPELQALLSDQTPFAKMGFSCLSELAVRQHLDQLERDHVLVCGIESHICVYQTAMDLYQSDYLVEVVVDAISSREAYQTANAIQRFHHFGILTTTVELALFELMKTAEHPKFRTIQSIVK